MRVSNTRGGTERVMEGTPELLLCGNVTGGIQSCCYLQDPLQKNLPWPGTAHTAEVTAPVGSSRRNGIVLSTPRNLRSVTWFSPLRKGLQGLTAGQGWNVTAHKGQIQMPTAAKRQDGSGSSFTGFLITAPSCRQPKQDQNK